MEKYYDAIEEKYQDFEFAIESIIYENELKYTYAMEKSNDASVASVDGSNQQTTVADKVANNLKPAEKKIGDAEKDAEQRDQNTTDNQAKGNDNPKIKQEVLNNVKQISEKISQFIREHIASLTSTMSIMLKEGADIEQELETVMRNSKVNENVVIRDYGYNNKFISEFNNAVNGAFFDYIKQYTVNLPKFGEVVQFIANGDMEKAKKYLDGMTPKTENQDNQSSAPSDTDSTTAATDEIVFERPCIFVARRLKVDKEKIGDLTPVNIKKYAYNHAKGVSEQDNKPKEYLLKNNMRILESSINFVKGYRAELQKLNTNRDNLTKCANNYQSICKDIQSMQSIDENLKNNLNRILTILSSHINELVTLNNFSITMLKERAISSEIIIRIAYTGKAKLAPAKKNENTNTEQPQEGQGNAQ